MAIKLNQEAYEHAVRLIKNGLEVEHDLNNWDEVEPTEDEVVNFIDTHSLKEYGVWFLGIDTDADPKDISKYLYPTGDLKIVHQSALLKSVEEAVYYGHEEIKNAAEGLLRLIKEKKR